MHLAIASVDLLANGRGPDPMIMGLIIGGVVLLVVLLLVVSHVRETRWVSALRALAMELGFEFQGPAIGPADAELAAMCLFQQGRAKKMLNVMNFAEGDCEESIFDYKYTTGHGKHSHTHSQTVVAFRGPMRDMPSFQVRPENLFHKIGSMFGYQDINFPDRPKFSGDFLLRGPDEEAIRDFFSHEMIDALEQRKGICVEASGDWLIVYRQGKRCKPEQIGEFLGSARELRDVFAGTRSAVPLR